MLWTMAQDGFWIEDLERQQQYQELLIKLGRNPTILQELAEELTVSCEIACVEQLLTVLCRMLRESML
jgi:HKD family nuclease